MGKPYKIKSGKYEGYDVLWTQGGQIFPRAGFYLSKNDGESVVHILYLEEALPKET